MKMKILTTCYDYRPHLGGVATFSHELTRALAREPGVEVLNIAPRASGDAEFDASSGVPTLRIQAPPRATRAVLPFSRALCSESLRFKPDVILNTLWMPGGAASLLSAPIHRIPYYLVAHGMELLESSQTFRKRLRAGMSPLKEQVFQRSGGVFANSAFTRELVVSETGTEPGRVRVIHCGVDPEEFHPERESGVARELGLEGRRILLTVSRLYDYKGIDRAISAMREVARRHPDVAYVVCGEGPDRKRLESLIRHYRVQKNVVIAGKIPQERLRDYYNAAEAFVLLTRSDWSAPNVEGFGIVFLEAASCAKPVVAGDSGGIPDAVAGGETGWLVDPTDDAAISRAMIECLDHPEEARRRGEAGRRRVLGAFTWSHVARRLLEGIHVRD
jgi:phosphatidylinositol alpha-1,6-mannosyltransferase